MSFILVIGVAAVAIVFAEPIGRPVAMRAPGSRLP